MSAIQIGFSHRFARPSNTPIGAPSSTAAIVAPPASSMLCQIRDQSWDDSYAVKNDVVSRPCASWRLR